VRSCLRGGAARICVHYAYTRLAARCRLHSAWLTAFGTALVVAYAYTWLAALGTGREAGSPRSESRSIRGRSSGGEAGDHWKPTETRSSAWPLILPGLPARGRPWAPGPHGRSLGERPRARRPRRPPLTFDAEMGRDPEGSCAAAPFRSWLHHRRLRSLDGRCCDVAQRIRWRGAGARGGVEARGATRTQTETLRSPHSL
jgi:hypothetical protein